MITNNGMKRQGHVLKGLFLVTQISFAMLAPIFLAGFLGYWLDRWFDISWIFLVLLLVGIAAGYRNVWHLIKGYMREEHAREIPSPTVQIGRAHV